MPKSSSAIWRGSINSASAWNGCPQSRPSVRHWHEREEEFVYVLTGELILVEEQEVILRAGDAAGWQAGAPHVHCLENRSSRSATVLIVGTRAPEETVH